MLSEHKCTQRRVDHIGRSKVIRLPVNVHSDGSSLLRVCQIFTNVRLMMRCSQVIVLLKELFSLRMAVAVVRRRAMVYRRCYVIFVIGEAAFPASRSTIEQVAFAACDVAILHFVRSLERL